MGGGSGGLKAHCSSTFFRSDLNTLILICVEMILCACIFMCYTHLSPFVHLDRLVFLGCAVWISLLLFVGIWCFRCCCFVVFRVVLSMDAVVGGLDLVLM